MGPRVVVAMSGGVDSAVAAALLQERGYEVLGVTLRLWSSGGPEETTEAADGCCSPRAIDDARDVAARLGIRHYTLNAEAEFDREVIRGFVAEYLAGRTPIPCLACNQRVKLGWLLRRALGWGAAFVATGHYARLAWDGATGRMLLRRAVDGRKDQTYFLYGLSQAQLRHVLFPLGDLTKGETRRLAALRGLPVADKPESQELCFAPGNDYRVFLRDRAPEAMCPGIIRTGDGTPVGSHPGVAFFTVGQRRGLGLSSRPAPAGKGSPRTPLYVVALDAERNEVIVGDEQALWTRTVAVEDPNLIPFDRLEAARRVLAKLRYAQPAAPATLLPTREGLRLRFDTPQRAAAPGQAAVFYDTEDPDLLLGGGIIAGTDRAQQWPDSCFTS